MQKTIKKCSNTFSNLYAPSLDDKCLFIHLTTDGGYYWRTSTLSKVSLVYLENNEWMNLILSSDSDDEENEYLILQELLAILHKYCTLYTFNGTAFSIPYLNNKFDAYGLDSPLKNAQNAVHYDLLNDYKSLYTFLKLPSRRLPDYSAFLSTDDMSEGEMLFNIIQLQPYLDFLNGKISPIQMQQTESASIFVFKLSTPVPKKHSFALGPYYILLEDCVGKISVRIENKMIRRYYPDYKNYDFLPEEGFAVHKSLSSFVKANRREPATVDTAYALVNPEKKLSSDLRLQKEYILSTIVYIRQKI